MSNSQPANTETQPEPAASMPAPSQAGSATPTRLRYSFARHHGVFLFSDAGSTAPHIVMRKGSNPRGLIEARRVLASTHAAPASLRVLETADFDKLLSQVYTAGDLQEGGLGGDVTSKVDDAASLDSLAGHIPETADLLDSDDDAPVIRLINGLIAEAVRRRGSDIHIEPFESSLSVRIRIDGVLSEVLSLPARVSSMLISRIKVMSRLDIAEKRIPQDGRISLSMAGRALDVRVSTLPSRHGERVVMRLLDREQARFSVEDLGMDAATKARFEALLLEPNGILLVTGPTGSGKTTSLYAGLSLLNEGSRNILTVEDPIEYALEGVGQTQVNTKVGMTFAAGLRAMLRQDPDVVMVGEIRDKETADIAVQASLTGHLVLSSVHTNSAAAAVTRLRDMGVEPYLLASTVKGIMAQRLVRLLCSYCKSAQPADALSAKLLGIEAGSPLYQAVQFQPPAPSTVSAHSAASTHSHTSACMHCGGTGYQGRRGIYELITVDDTLAEMIHDDARESQIRAYAFQHVNSLRDSGFELVRRGLTTLDEIMRVVRSEADAATPHTAPLSAPPRASDTL